MEVCSRSCQGDRSSARYQLLTLVFSAQRAVSVVVTARNDPEVSKAQAKGFPETSMRNFVRSPLRASTRSISPSSRSRYANTDVVEAPFSVIRRMKRSPSFATTLPVRSTEKHNSLSKSIASRSLSIQFTA
jgi:hypothetical protein